MFPDFKIKNGQEIPLDGCNPLNETAAKYLKNTRVRQIDNSLTTMRGFGNTSSVTVLTEIRLEMQAYERRIAAGVNDESFPALMVACGPGFTAEWAYGKFFARPEALRSATQSIERPVCFTMELPRLDVVVIGMGITGAFLATKLCECGLNVASVANLKEESRTEQLPNGDLPMLVEKLGIKASMVDKSVDVVESLKKILKEYRTDDVFVPYWEYKLVRIDRAIDVERKSRVEFMNNHDIVSVVLEHTPTGITQQVQTRFVVATEQSPSAKIVDAFKVKYPNKAFVLDIPTNDLTEVLIKGSDISEAILSKTQGTHIE